MSQPSNENLHTDTAENLTAQDQDEDEVFISGDYYDDDDSDHHSSGSSSTDDSVSITGLKKKTLTKEEKVVHEIVTKETANVLLWRAVVLLVLVVVGILVSVGAMAYLEHDEHRDAQKAFDMFVRNVQHEKHEQMSLLQDAFDSLGEMFTSHVLESNGTVNFPFVTLPMFEVEAQHVRRLANVEVFAFAPLVSNEQMIGWEQYSAQHYAEWVEISQHDPTRKMEQTAYPGQHPLLNLQLPCEIRSSVASPSQSALPCIYEGDLGRQQVSPVPDNRELYLPLWQTSPPPDSPIWQNFDLLNPDGPVYDLYQAVQQTREPILSQVFDLSALTRTFLSPTNHNTFHEEFLRLDSTMIDTDTFRNPHALMMSPVFAELENNAGDVAGVFIGVIPLDAQLASLVPDGVNGMLVVLHNTCGQAYSYEIFGSKAIFLGEGDLHDTKFDDELVMVPFGQFMHQDTRTLQGHCVYTFHVYPSNHFNSYYMSKTPQNFMLLFAVTFMFMVLVFCTYDRFVQQRNIKLVRASKKATAIVSSLFPTRIRDRLFADAAGGVTATTDDTNDRPAGGSQGPQSRLQTFLTGGTVTDNSTRNEATTLSENNKPIAELFPHTTVFFADIAGFTAWSSEREPCQVFTLLETLYRAFDEIAAKRGVFKVETVGDCYVAVTGLPDPRDDHAVVMARFARDSMHKMNALTRKLEVTLGPDTGDLCMRAGLHSGPVTAGVLRGERSRFQLFGDTVNTAARMESNGLKGRIQISEETAALLVAAGKKHWICPRKDTIHAKGKGEMHTYWLGLGTDRGKDVSFSRSESTTITGTESSERHREGEIQIDSSHAHGKKASSKIDRLIEWNVDVLLRLVKQIVVRRDAAGLCKDHVHPGDSYMPDLHTSSRCLSLSAPSGTVLGEAREIIKLPNFNVKAALQEADPNSISLDDAVVEQMSDYVHRIALLYREHAFHNFEHASHMTMSVVKLLSSILAPAQTVPNIESPDVQRTLHDHSFGITSDPLTQFACVFSALIHDVDHPGVPNSQLVKENAEIAIACRGQSVAEQHSVNVAWKLFMEHKYKDLRAVICATASEMKRFRQLVVNAVIATDLYDPELKARRNDRWEKAFSSSPSEQQAASGDSTQDQIDRKATIVIEHLIQASDVAHTMQHWQVYRKWNERLFLEAHDAYIAGRASASEQQHPAEYWYQGELDFFDNYILPLAQKLQDCGVFGVSSDEYLNYADKNRKEWSVRGQDVVTELVEKLGMDGHAPRR